MEKDTTPILDRYITSLRFDEFLDEHELGNQHNLLFQDQFDLQPKLSISNLYESYCMTHHLTSHSSF